MALTLASRRSKDLAWLISLPVAGLLGAAVGLHRQSLLMGAIGLGAAAVVATWPRIGLYAVYPLLLWVPYGAQRINSPLFHSPLQVIALLVVGVGIARHLLDHKPVAPSRVYLPMVLFVGVTAVFALAGHGPGAGNSFLRLTQGFWPVVAIVLLADAPAHARRILAVLIGSFLVLALFWLPGLLRLVGTSANTVRLAGAGSPTSPGLAVHLLGVTGSLSYITLVAMVIAAPLPLALGMRTRRWRRLGIGTFAILAAVLTLSTYAAALIGLGAATLCTVLLPTRRSDGPRRSLPAVAAVGLVVVLVLGTPVAQHAIRRIEHPASDVSGRERLTALNQGWHAFLGRPLTGVEVTSTYTVTSNGVVLDAHNSAVTFAWEYGLVGLVPFVWLLAEAGWLFVELRRNATGEVDVAVAVAMLSALFTTVVLSFVTPVFGQVYQDTVLWTLVGVGIVWRDWQRHHPDVPVFA